MIRALARFILAMYPPWWKRRYGAETSELTEQLLAEPGAHQWRVVGSLLTGSMRAWMQLRRISDYLKPVDNPEVWGMIPVGSHRDIFGNRGLWPRSEAELEPGEVLLGVLDGNIGSVTVGRLPGNSLGYTVAYLAYTQLLAFMYLDGNAHIARSMIWSAITAAAVCLICSVPLRALTKTQNVAVAVTNHGVLIFRRGITGRTGTLIERIPAVSPVLVRSSSRMKMRSVRLGERTLWLQGSSDPLLSWMSYAYRPAGAL